MITYQDILVNDKKNKYHVSLLKFLNKQVLDIVGTLSIEFGHVSFKLLKIIFTDGNEMFVEGEHDHPYVVEVNLPLTNFDEQTLTRLYKEKLNNE